MTDPSELEALKRNPQIVRLIGQRVKLVKTGREMTGSCPFHSEKTPSFKIYQKDGIWLATCHGGCGTFNLLQVVHKMDGGSFTDAIKRVNEFLGTAPNRVDEVFKPVVEDSTPKKTFSLEEYAKLEKALEESQEAKDWLANTRGIGIETARKLHLGYRQDVGRLAAAAGSDYRSFEALGWIALPRISNDRITGIHYRSIARKAFVRQPGMGTHLFNEGAIDPLEPVYVTEGEFDAAVLAQAGFHAVSLPNATSHLTPEQKDLLMQAEYVVLAGDTDAAGEACMAKLATTLGEKCYLLRWPSGKDANEFLLGECKRDIRVFETRIKELTSLARSQPMANVYDLKATMLGAGKTNLVDHPLRFHWPWVEVDRMAILLPGSVITVSATNTGCGKSAFCLQATLDAARLRGEVVINYQCELSADEVSTMAVAHLLRKDRNHLSPGDGKLAVQKMDNVRYYVGHDPTLNTVEPVLDLIEAAIIRTGATCAVLDHIHAVIGNVDNEVQALANAMVRIKKIAQKYGLKFFVVAQPRKANQASKGKSIHVTDLKGSEALASAADAVFTLHRDYTKNSNPNAPAKDEYDPITDVHLLKVRAKGDGAAQARLYFLGVHSTFLDLNEVEKKDLTNSDEDATMFTSH